MAEYQTYQHRTGLPEKRIRYIYRITAGNQVYIGQSSSMDFLHRIYEHITIAYGLPYDYGTFDHYDKEQQRPVFAREGHDYTENSNKIYKAIARIGAYKCDFDYKMLPKQAEDTQSGYQEFKQTGSNTYMDYNELMAIAHAQILGTNLTNVELKGRHGSFRPKMSYLHKSFQGKNSFARACRKIQTIPSIDLQAITYDYLKDSRAYAIIQGGAQIIKNLRITSRDLHDIIQGIPELQKDLQSALFTKKTTIDKTPDIIDAIITKVPLSRLKTAVLSNGNNGLKSKNIPIEITLNSDLTGASGFSGFKMTSTALVFDKKELKGNFIPTPDPEGLVINKKFGLSQDTNNQNLLTMNFIDIKQKVKDNYLYHLFKLYDEQIQKRKHENQMDIMGDLFSEPSIIKDNGARFYDEFMNVINYQRFGPLRFTVDYRGENIRFKRSYDNITKEAFTSHGWSTATEQDMDEMIKHDAQQSNPNELTIG